MKSIIVISKKLTGYERVNKFLKKKKKEYKCEQMGYFLTITEPL